MFQYNTSVPSLQNLNFKMPPNFEGLDPTMSGWCWEGWIDVQGLKALVGSTNWSYNSYTTPYDTVVTTRQTSSWHGTSSIIFRASFVNPYPGTLEDLSFTNYPFFRNYSSGTIRLQYSPGCLWFFVIFCPELCPKTKFCRVHIWLGRVTFTLYHVICHHIVPAKIPKTCFSSRRRVFVVP